MTIGRELSPSVEKYKPIQSFLRFAIGFEPLEFLSKWRTETMGKPTVVIYADGSCDSRGNGGYACSLTCGDESIYISGNEKATTSQRMEITAVIRALETLKTECNVVLFSDSQYVVNCLTKWITMWRRNGWRKQDGSGVANQDLLEKLAEVKSKYRIRANWVRGHNGNQGNEIVDSLAQYSRGLITFTSKKK